MGGLSPQVSTGSTVVPRLSKVDTHDQLMKEMSLNSQVWMSHADTITALSDHYQIIASTEDVEVAAYKMDQEPTYGIQFHPEVTHSEEGKTVLRNFVVHICQCSQDWTPDIFVESTVCMVTGKVRFRQSSDGPCPEVLTPLWQPPLFIKQLEINFTAYS